MKTIGFIGTGVMGSPIVRHLAQKNYRLNVFNRTTSKAEKLRDVAKVYTDVSLLIKESDIIFTMLGFPNDVKQIYDIILDVAKPNTIVIDMTTSSPKLALELYRKGKEKNIKILDAPVTGGEVGAINGTLTMMVGGDIEVFEQMKDLFSVFAKNINYIGGSSLGQKAKLANQVAIAGAIWGVAESLSFAKNSDIHIDTMLQILNSGSAYSWQSINNGNKMITKDFKPGFYIKHFVKDLKLALEESNTDLSLVRNVIMMYESLDEETYDKEGIQALIRYYK